MYNIESKITELIQNGVEIVDPRQVYIAQEVSVDRVRPGAVLYPGTRLTGERTFIGTGAKIGTEGPAVISNTVIGAAAKVASGYLDDTTLLPRASVGANCHCRGGTLLEEEASTAHCVGLKQTILMYGVTMGSLINFCDALLTGGSSRKSHTEVGSGFIHFNYTPWGATGDKATASLIGTVTEGVFLDKPQIFLGGMSGIVGPQSVGFGAMTPAGQVIRHRVGENTMRAERLNEFEREFTHDSSRPSDRHMDKKRESNVEYMAQLYALIAWYEQVRLRRSELAEDRELELVYESAVDTIKSCVAERLKRWNSYAKEWGQRAFDSEIMDAPAPTFDRSVEWKPELDHDQWVWQLTAAEKTALHYWLCDCANSVRNRL